MICASKIPLSLYIHIPWCEKKCPYCDFNSHEGFREDLQNNYIQALLIDLTNQVKWINGRSVSSVFIGGGTPSLFSGNFISQLLTGVRNLLPLDQDVEITLESNPSSAERGRYEDYFSAGINRLSIGVQSFNDARLALLGRVHSAQDARQALMLADEIGFTRLNIDLMYGLPGQNLTTAIADLEEGLHLTRGHLSWYQLTIERNTQFWKSKPSLPDELIIDAIQFHGASVIEKAGLKQYEVSAYSLPGEICRHNFNYWSFGDYLGIGAGAHGKISRNDGQILRTRHPRNPNKYLTKMRKNRKKSPVVEPITSSQLTAEFIMNALRLAEGCSLEVFEKHTGLNRSQLEKSGAQSIDRGWLRPLSSGKVAATPLGYRFLDSVVASFL